MSATTSDERLLRHLYNTDMPLEGRLRMLNVYYNRATTLDELWARAALVAQTPLPEDERELALLRHRTRLGWRQR